MNILFLCNRPSNNSQASTVTEYLDALGKFSKNKIFEISMLNHFPSKINLQRFDVIVTHYSLSLGPLVEYYYGKDLLNKIKKFNGLKVAFLQDEYRHVNLYWKHINELGIDILFSCVPSHEIKKVYPDIEVPNLRVVNVLTGYVPESLLSLKKKPINKRLIDVGYRSRKTPYWLGKLGYEKFFISEEFKRRAEQYNITVNFSTKEGDRLYGNDWINFVTSCRALIGVESGSSIVDFNGSIEKMVEAYIAKNPNTDFEDVFNKFLKPFEGNINLHQISPRCFEAIALKTPLILFEGNYSGILKKNKHFIPLKKDFSNFDEVIQKLSNHSYLQKMVNRAYVDVACNPRFSYQHFIGKIDKIIDVEFKKRKKTLCKNRYTVQEFKRDITHSVGYIVRRKITLFFQFIFLGTPIFRSLIFWLWEITPSWGQSIIRPLAKIISR